MSCSASGKDVVLALRVCSGAVDKLEMPPEDSNWDGNWKLVQEEQLKGLCVVLEKMSLEEQQGGEGDDRKLFSNI